MALTNRDSAPARRRGRPPKSNALPLNRKLIIDTALDMTRAEVAQPLTFRALGTRLGVDPSALYRYIPSKDGLLLAVADGIIQEALESFGESPHWRADLYQVLSRVHHSYLQHPQVAAAAATRVTRLEAETIFSETVLAILQRAGLNSSQAVITYRALEDTMLAWTGFRAGVSLMPDPDKEIADWEQAYLHADPQAYPRVVSLATAITAVSLQEGFDESITLILDGIECRLTRQEAHSQHPHGPTTDHPNAPPSHK